MISALLLAFLWFVAPVVFPDDFVLWAMAGAAAAVLAVLVWWLFFSRAPWSERVGAILLAILAIVATRRVVHPSIAGGMMGFMLYIYTVPVLGLALVAGALAGRRLPRGRRFATMAGAILLACGAFTLIRTDGIRGVGSDLHWRWTPTSEDRLLARAASEQDPAPTATVAVASEKPAVAKTADASIRPTTGTDEPKDPGTTAEWPGFRGPERDNIVRGVRIETDWSKSPPVELWRRPIGPGWSSFAVQGNRIYTQEQRGDDEIVSCYDLKTGAPVWRHRDKARFWESNAGTGPRGTPAVSNGRVYALGATGILNALDARDGSVLWSRNAASDTKREIPFWGFAGSPLVVGADVVVATAGVLVAYDAGTGNLRWIGPAGGGGYSSPQLATIGGVAQILLLSGQGATSVSPVDGKLLWKHEWNSDGIVQPFVIANGDVLIGSGSGGAEVGMRRIAVAHDPTGGPSGAWKVEERWTTKGLKPYFNDFVVHEGHAFGFDGSILSCIDLAEGNRKWKGGRYGQGQMVLLPDQDVLLVLSEEGELALVGATPDQSKELARFKAIEGKTWNHPALVGDVLLVRNDQEMAAFRLAVARSASEGGR